MKDTSNRAEVATHATEATEATEAAHQAWVERQGERLVAQFFTRLKALFDELAAWHLVESNELFSPEGSALGDMADRFITGLPGLIPHARSYETCLAFSAALFGQDFVPSEDANPVAVNNYGAAAHEAFTIARVFLAAPMDSPEQHLLCAAAVVAHGETQRRRQSA